MAKKKERDNSITKNRRASFEFALEERYEAGIVLTGPEIKSIRAKKVSISEAYCYIDSKGILRIKGMRISEFKNAGYMLQNPDREKLLLLTKNELKKINNVTVLQSNRWNEILEKMLSKTRNTKLSEDFVKSMMELLHVESIRIQNDISNR